MTVQSVIQRISEQADRRIYIWINCVVGLILLGSFVLLVFANKSDLRRLEQGSNHTLIAEGCLLAVGVPLFFLFRKKRKYRLASFLVYALLLAWSGSAALVVATLFLMQTK
jgi:hypothetical protein